ncbi:hypothetical protein [Rhizobium sp.]|uniref:hypothetical protein n=1 Tax=Rhizobium sp. TaxID=391 RepID=UPI00289795E4
MSNDNTQLFRIEVSHPTGQIECHPCLHRDQIGELLAQIANSGPAAEGIVIEIFDHKSWRPDLTSKSLVRFRAV